MFDFTLGAFRITMTKSGFLKLFLVQCLRIYIFSFQRLHGNSMDRPSHLQQGGSPASGETDGTPLSHLFGDPAPDLAVGRQALRELRVVRGST
jgi:hypothetical protein